MDICLVRIVEFQENDSIHPRDVIPSFELLNVSSLLKKNHKIQYLDNEILSKNSKSFLNLILNNKSDLLIIHFQPTVANQMSKMIKEIKKKTNKIVIAFGTTVEYKTLYFLQESRTDYAILGEVELSLLELINDLSLKKVLTLKQLKKINGIAFLHNNSLVKTKPRELLNPNILPFMSHELIQNEKYKVVSKIIRPLGKIKWGFILSSRGCPYKCQFCSPSIRYSYGNKYRYQTPKRTVNEIEYLIKKYGVNAISFEDDIFTLSKDRVVKICQEIIKRNIKVSWTVATRLDCLNQKMINLMKKAGCQGVSTGIESGSDRILQIVKKGENIHQIKKGIQMLQNAKIAVTANIIIGHPTETEKDLQLTLDLIKSVKPAFIHLHYLTPYPGAKLFLEYTNKLNKFKDYTHRKSHEFNISSVNTERLHKTFKKIYYSHYLSFSFLKNYFKYRLNYWLYDPVFEIKFITKTFLYLILINSK